VLTFVADLEFTKMAKFLRSEFDMVLRSKGKEK
jgi:hypothetical protein